MTNEKQKKINITGIKTCVIQSEIASQRITLSHCDLINGDTGVNNKQFFTSKSNISTIHLIAQKADPRFFDVNQGKQ